MKGKKIVQTLLMCSLILTPTLADAEGELDKDNVKQNIDSKIAIVDDLLADSKRLSKLSMELSIDSEKEIVTSEQEFLEDVNKIHIDVEDYFSTIDSEDFYDMQEFTELINKLDLLDLEVEKHKNTKQKFDISATASTWRYGDVLAYGIGSDNAAGETSFTGHTAVLSTTQYYVIEAARTRNNGAKVFHWNRDNLWSGASGIKQYKITDLLGNEASTADKIRAVNFGLDQEDDPYALKTTLFTDDGWYCSKLTFRQWFENGYDLRGARGLIVGDYLLVIPNDIMIDANTRLIKDWGTKLLGRL